MDPAAELAVTRSLPDVLSVKVEGHSQVLPVLFPYLKYPACAAELRDRTMGTVAGRGTDAIKEASVTFSASFILLSFSHR